MINETRRPQDRPRDRPTGPVATFVATFARFGRPLLILVPLLYVFTFLPRMGRMDRGDAANAYHQAAESIRDGRSMYEPLPPTGLHRVGNYHP